MKQTRKILSVLLAALMLLSVAPMAFAVEGACEHKNAYDVEVKPKGSADKYFKLSEHTYGNDGTTYSLRYCPDCKLFQRTDTTNGYWQTIEGDYWFEYYGICKPGACVHPNRHKIEVRPEGSETEYFMLSEPIIPEFASYELYGCATCESIGVCRHNEGGGNQIDWVGYHGSFAGDWVIYLGIIPPGACAHKNKVTLGIEPTCKEMYFDFIKYEKLIYPQRTDEEIRAAAQNYGVEEPLIGEVSECIPLFYYCEDCKQPLFGTHLSRKDGKEFSTGVPFSYLVEAEFDETTEMTKEELVDALNACLIPAEPHTYTDGKCIYCGQSESSQPSEQPTETKEKGILDSLMDFIKIFIEMLKDLFSADFFKKLFH